MSAIGGVFYRSGEALDTRIPRRLAAGLATMGPDGVQFEYSTRVGMVFCHFAIGDSEDQVPQPQVDEDGFILTFDGWLDNPGEIAASLSNRHQPQTTCDLILAVYRRWGVDGFARLVGNFALALWDPYLTRTILATDGLGFRPIYFYADDDRLVWSSRARALADALDLEPRIDNEMVASFLANTVTDHGPFEGIENLPGGYVLIADNRGLSRCRYWNFDPENEIRYADDRDYEERFSELFEQAVACRLRGSRPVFAELSGGVDSSSIVCMADELMRGGRLPNRPLHTISYVFDQAKTADERPYIHQIEQAAEFVSHHLREEDYPILSKRPPRGWQPDLPTNQISYLARYDRVAQLMQNHGGRVLLSGLGGDQCVFAEDLHAPLELADLWLQRRPGDMLQAAYLWARTQQRPLLQVLWRGALVPLSSRGRQTANRRPPAQWLRQDFVERTCYSDRTRGPADDLGFRLPSRGFQYSVLRQTMRVFALQKCVSQRHFEVRYPYLDRRLLEFTLAIPIDQHLRPNQTRSLVRRALKGRMPACVLNRRTKAGPTEAFQRALVRERRWIGSLFENSLLERIGVIDGAKFRQALSNARHGMVSQPAQMHRTVSLELWLRSMSDTLALEGGRPNSDCPTSPTSEEIGAAAQVASPTGRQG